MTPVVSVAGDTAAGSAFARRHSIRLSSGPFLSLAGYVDVSMDTRIISSPDQLPPIETDWSQAMVTHQLQPVEPQTCHGLLQCASMELLVLSAAVFV
ncbi:MAG: hypothetical protein V5A37_01850, partial [Halobacteriales archaeon]